MAERGLSMHMSTCASGFMSMSTSMSSAATSPAVAALSGDELLKDERSSSDRLRLSSIVAGLAVTGLDWIVVVVWGRGLVAQSLDVTGIWRKGPIDCLEQAALLHGKLRALLMHNVRGKGQVGGRGATIPNSKHRWWLAVWGWGWGDATVRRQWAIGRAGAISI